MSDFATILNATGEDLVQLFCRYKDDGDSDKRLDHIAAGLGLRPKQLVCAIGFNPSAGHASEIFTILGYADFAELCRARNEIFTTDTYYSLRLEDVLQIYGVVKDDAKALDAMQYLLTRRIDNIERKIEVTVSPRIIERYKAEMRAIYHDGIAQIDFAEARLNKPDFGFRALLGEVTMIIDSRLIPAGDIFFRETILPEEKRRILNMGLIPHELIQSRLGDTAVSAEEQRVLQDYLQQHPELR